MLTIFVVASLVSGAYQKNRSKKKHVSKMVPRNRYYLYDMQNVRVFHHYIEYCIVKMPMLRCQVRDKPYIVQK